MRAIRAIPFHFHLTRELAVVYSAAVAGCTLNMHFMKFLLHWRTLGQAA